MPPSNTPLFRFPLSLVPSGFAFLIPASYAGARSLLIRGTCDLLPDGPTRPIQRLPVRGTVHLPAPEPPLLLVLPARGALCLRPLDYMIYDSDVSLRNDMFMIQIERLACSLRPPALSFPHCYLFKSCVFCADFWMCTDRKSLEDKELCLAQETPRSQRARPLLSPCLLGALRVLRARIGFGCGRRPQLGLHVVRS